MKAEELMVNALVQRARGSVRLQQVASKVRYQRSRWIGQPLRQLEQARRLLDSGEADILYLGDSSCITWTFDDTDRTLIPQLLEQRVGSKVAVVAGAGYGANLYAEVVRLLATLERRPRAVVLTFTVRPNLITHVSRHPQFSYDNATRAMSRIPHARRRIRALGRGGITDTPEERAAFLATPIPTRWGGEITIGEFRQRLMGQGPPPWPPELEAMRFNYFHGEIVPPDHRGYAEMRELGRHLAAWGVPVVSFWGIPPMERGEMHFPGEFEKHVTEHHDRLLDALHEGFPAMPSLVDVDLVDADFEESCNGNEHYRYSGRAKIADALAQRIAAL